MLLCGQTSWHLTHLGEFFPSFFGRERNVPFGVNPAAFRGDCVGFGRTRRGAFGGVGRVCNSGECDASTRTFVRLVIRWSLVNR